MRSGSTVPSSHASSATLLLALFQGPVLHVEGRRTMESVVANMGRKSRSTSVRVAEKLVYQPRRMHRPAVLRRPAPVPRSLNDQSLDRRSLADGSEATFGQAVTDVFPEFVPVVDGELDAIEAYLAAQLKAMLGHLN